MNNAAAANEKRRRAVAVYYPFTTKRSHDIARRVAGAAVCAAVRDGSLKRAPCVVCGKERSEAHHEDYSRPLDVVWMCRPHHRRRDQELKEERLARLKDLPVAFVNKHFGTPEKTAPAPHGRVSHKWRSVVMCQSTVDLVIQATREVSNRIGAEGLSQNQVAKRLGVSRQMVNMQFLGGFRSLRVIAAYANALGYEARVVLRKRKTWVDKCNGTDTED